ncbi:TPA: helix-turn-helix domain-containing protein [Enterobacter hormaechei subsp. xiangfangensis]|nr:helix-turn-helix domain-containing protein [Enterobacter hormaechei subsp. xiangfangensis]
MNAPTRPESTINRLLEALTPEATQFSPSYRISMRRNDVVSLYLLLDGECSVLRITDNLTLGTVYQPHIFGLAEMFSFQHTCYLSPQKHSTFLHIETSKARSIFTKKELWQDVAILLSYHTAYLNYRDNMNLQSRAYLVVRNYLSEIIQLPYEKRMKTSVLQYIQERTCLSRSSILNPLRVLKRKHYISLMHGCFLIDIHAPLPEAI